MYLSVGRISHPNYSTPYFGYAKRKRLKKGLLLWSKKKEQSTHNNLSYKKEIFYYQMSITYFTKEGYWAHRKSPQGFYKTGNSETGLFKVAFFIFIFLGAQGDRLE